MHEAESSANGEATCGDKFLLCCVLQHWDPRLRLARTDSATGVTCATTDSTADTTGATFAAIAVTLRMTAATCETTFASATTKTRVATVAIFAVTSVT